MGKKAITIRVPNPMEEGLREYAAENGIENNRGEVSEGRAARELVDGALRDRGYLGHPQTATDGGLPVGWAWEGAKVSLAAAAGLVIAELIVDAPVSLYPHIGGFLIAAIVCLILDRLAPAVAGRIPAVFQRGVDE